MNKKAFNYSDRSADLYYVTKLFEFSMKNDWIKGVKEVLLVIPYYYFDYDMSQSYNTVTYGSLMAYWQMNDWHNANKK